MGKFVEWDIDNPVHRRRRPPQIFEGEVLSPSEPQSRVRVDVHHHHYRQRSAVDVSVSVPPWFIALLIFAALLWISPIGLIVAIAIVSIFVIQHPAIVITSGMIVAALVINSLRRRRVAIRGN
jgi:hypothetical protein